MTHLAKHACEDRALVVLRSLPDLSEPERAQRPVMPLGLADLALHLRDLDLGHYDSSVAASSAGGTSRFPPSPSTGPLSRTGASAAGAGDHGRISEICLPRAFATSSGRRRFLSPSTAALSMLIGFVVPRLLARTSRIPASSSTARTP